MELTEIIIKKEILEIEKPFKIADLIRILNDKNIKNTNLIFSVLDQLLNAGLVECKDIVDDDIFYSSLLTAIPV